MMDRPTSEELKQRWRQAVAEAEADKPAVIARDKQLWAALQEQSLSSEFRRIIFDSPLSTGEIAEQAGIPVGEINAFLHGEATLSSEALDRIARVLDCHLTAAP
jgi:DNA-directed RNA polymerase specialized sigma24 family protein